MSCLWATNKRNIMKRQRKLRSIKDKRKNVIKLRHPVAPPTRSYDPRKYNRSKEKQEFLQDLREVYNV